MENLIRKAERRDTDDIMEIVAAAQLFLKEQGVDQWQNGYPTRLRVTQDIEGGIAWVLEAGGRVQIYAVLDYEPELSYETIEGAWRAEPPYVTLHRLAARAGARGAGLSSQLLRGLEAAARQTGHNYMRADTHPQNTPMNRFLQKNGYAACGTVYIVQDGIGGAAGDPRVAYDKWL